MKRRNGDAGVRGGTYDNKPYKSPRRRRRAEDWILRITGRGGKEANRSEDWILRMTGRQRPLSLLFVVTIAVVAMRVVTVSILPIAIVLPNTGSKPSLTASKCDVGVVEIVVGEVVLYWVARRRQRNLSKALLELRRKLLLLQDLLLVL